MDVRPLDEGDNFRLSMRDGVAWCEVWSRPDVSAADGTRFAAVLSMALRGLLTDRDHPSPGLVLDVRAAPRNTGPNTFALLGEVVQTWALAGRRVSFLVGDGDQQAEMLAFVASLSKALGGTSGDGPRGDTAHSGPHSAPHAGPTGVFLDERAAHAHAAQGRA